MRPDLPGAIAPGRSIGRTEERRPQQCHPPRRRGASLLPARPERFRCRHSWSSLRLRVVVRQGPLSCRIIHADKVRATDDVESRRLLSVHLARREEFEKLIIDAVGYFCGLLRVCLTFEIV